MSGKKSIRSKVATHSQFFFKWKTIGRIDRKSWNKALDIIEGGLPSSQSGVCSRYGNQSRVSSKLMVGNTRVTVKLLLIEIRQALLRHDWKTVHRLHMCLLDDFIKDHRAVSNKLMLTSLLSSSMSDHQIYADFCRMAMGMDDAEMKVFTKTIKRLPPEIPRGFATAIKGKIIVRESLDRSKNDGATADSYLKASLPVREEEDDDSFD